jgi:hypothetical protein
MRWAPVTSPAFLLRHERGAVALNATLVCGFTLFVLGSGAVSVRSFARLLASYVGIALIVLAFALVLYAGQVVIRSGRASRWRDSPSRALIRAFSARWRDERMFCLAWPVALFLLLMPTFNAFKQRILPDAGFHLDPALARIDRALFGADPGLVLHALIGSPATTRFFDAVYHSWFVPTTLGLCVVGLCATPRTRAQYVTAYVATWILLGAVAAYLLPAAGPAFYASVVGSAGAEPFVAVQHQLEQAGGADVVLTSLFNQSYLLANLGSELLVVGGGISAIPSIHNAMAVLFALASFRWHWLAGLAMSAFALLVWVASIYLNWHYAIDGVAGALGAVVLWFGSGWLVDRIAARQDRASPYPEILKSRAA